MSSTSNYYVFSSVVVVQRCIIASPFATGCHSPLLRQDVSLVGLLLLGLQCVYGPRPKTPVLRPPERVPSHNVPDGTYINEIFEGRFNTN